MNEITITTGSDLQLLFDGSYTFPEPGDYKVIFNNTQTNFTFGLNGLIRYNRTIIFTSVNDLKITFNNANGIVFTSSNNEKTIFIFENSNIEFTAFGRILSNNSSLNNSVIFINCNVKFNTTKTTLNILNKAIFIKCSVEFNLINSNQTINYVIVSDFIGCIVKFNFTGISLENCNFNHCGIFFVSQAKNRVYSLQSSFINCSCIGENFSFSSNSSSPIIFTSINSIFHNIEFKSNGGKDTALVFSHNYFEKLPNTNSIANYSTSYLDGDVVKYFYSYVPENEGVNIFIKDPYTNKKSFYLSNSYFAPNYISTSLYALGVPCPNYMGMLSVVVTDYPSEDDVLLGVSYGISIGENQTERRGKLVLPPREKVLNVEKVYVNPVVKELPGLIDIKEYERELEIKIEKGTQDD